MTLQKVKAIAKTNGIRVGKNMKKENLIRTIQRAEGNDGTPLA